MDGEPNRLPLVSHAKNIPPTRPGRLAQRHGKCHPRTRAKIQMTDRQRLEIGFTHQRAGRLREAEAIYREFLANQPNHPEALQLLAGVAAANGQYDTAINLLKQAIQVNPNIPLFHANIGSLYLQTLQLDEAIPSLQRAIQLNPSLVPAYYNLGNAL